MTRPRVAIVGAGISGAACAVALQQAGVPVDVLDRGRAPGGRLASPELQGRAVDLGAAYFTVSDPRFEAVANGWRETGLARAWTDTLSVFDADGRHDTAGPMRWAAGLGLRSLVRDLLPVEVDSRHEVRDVAELDADAIVVAMPDPQARRLVGDQVDGVEWVDYDPVITVAAGWSRRLWSLEAAAFVNADPDVAMIADDGSRRGDSAPVLVAHSTSSLARRHLHEPDAAIRPVAEATARLLGIDELPEWTHEQRWAYAKPAATHSDASFAIVEHGGRPLGLCGDAWCPSGSPRVESAWLSGTSLGEALADRLA